MKTIPTDLKEIVGRFYWRIYDWAYSPISGDHVNCEMDNFHESLNSLHVKLDTLLERTLTPQKEKEV